MGRHRTARPRSRQLLLLLLGSAVGRAAGQAPVAPGEVREPTELPAPGWPASTAEQSMAAWSSGRQPERLAAWPQIGYGTANRTLLTCWKKTVLHDVAEGWPDLCLNLFQAKRRTDMASCRRVCWDEPRCPVWQFNIVPGGPPQCWVGFGTDCGHRNGVTTAFTVAGGQRLMHGEVRVLRNMSGPKINNLYNLGPYRSGNLEADIYRCKVWCYSVISCQYWQYGADGCWVDAPYFSTGKGNNLTNVVQYPLTASGLSNATAMTAGEYIQHYCPLGPTSTSTEPLPPSITTTTTVEAVLAAAAAAAAMAANGAAGANPTASPGFAAVGAAPAVGLEAVAGGGGGFLFSGQFYGLLAAVCICLGAAVAGALLFTSRGAKGRSKRTRALESMAAAEESEDDSVPLMTPSPHDHLGPDGSIGSFGGHGDSFGGHSGQEPWRSGSQAAFVPHRHPWWPGPAPPHGWQAPQVAPLGPLGLGSGAQSFSPPPPGAAPWAAPVAPPQQPLIAPELSFGHAGHPGPSAPPPGPAHAAPWAGAQSGQPSLGDFPLASGQAGAHAWQPGYREPAVAPAHAWQPGYREPVGARAHAWQSEYGELPDQFSLMDHNQDGVVSWPEFREAIQAGHVHLPPRMLQAAALGAPGRAQPRVPSPPPLLEPRAQPRALSPPPLLEPSVLEGGGIHHQPPPASYA